MTHTQRLSAQRAARERAAAIRAARKGEMKMDSLDWETISQEEYERRFEQAKQVVRSRIFLTAAFPELLEAYLRFTKSLYGKDSARTGEAEREYNVEPERLLTGHSHVMNAKSARCKTLRRLADAVIEQAELPMMPVGMFRGDSYRVNWRKAWDKWCVR